MSRIAYDLDGTIVGLKDGIKAFLRPGIIPAIKKLKTKGHTVILWTFGNDEWWQEVRRMFPELRNLFHEVYTRDNMLHHMTFAKNMGMHAVKDIRKIAADVLVDNDPSHHRWARRHGLAKKYVLVKTIGD